MGKIEAKADKPIVLRGDKVTISLHSCYEPPDYSLWARFREAESITVPMSFNKDKHEWAFVVSVTQEVQPGTYHVDFFAKNAKGDVVREFPQSDGVTTVVTWEDEASQALLKWHLDKEKLVRDSTERLDKTYAGIPEFPVVGVWFDALNYHKHNIVNSEKPGPWNPYLRKTFNDEIDYLSKTLGLNLIVMSGGTAEENARARSAFPFFITSAPQKGDYAIYDEPDYMNRPMEDVIKWAKDAKTKGYKTIVNFSGHKADDTWTDYVFKFLDKYVPDVVSVDCYPVFYDFANMEYFRQRVKAVGKAAHEKNAKFFVILQGFAQKGTWSYPTTFYWQKMLEACKEAEADGLIFFMWTSGASERDFIAGMDMLPMEYHRMLYNMVDRKPASPAPAAAVKKPEAKPEAEKKPAAKPASKPAAKQTSPSKPAQKKTEPSSKKEEKKSDSKKSSTEKSKKTEKKTDAKNTSKTKEKKSK